MLTRLSLRLRVLLFFALLGLGGAVLALAALWFAAGRAQAAGPEAGFAMAAVLIPLGFIGLTTAIWLLFDENVARPVEQLAAQMRARAHAGVNGQLDTEAARYLGDLAPAADAVAQALSRSAMDSAQIVAQETARLAAEKARLTSLLTEIPVAMVLVNPADQIVLYDGQAADVLAQVHVPRLNASLFDYFDRASLSTGLQKMRATGREVRLTATSADGRQSYDARLRPLDEGSYMLVIDDATAQIAPDAARPLVYDFGLMNPRAADRIEDTPLDDLVFTVFDSETTGLLPHKDEIVQLGAVRVLGGRIVPGEQIDMLVDPGRPIPPASTRVHRITDSMVAGQPRIDAASRILHRFAEGSVIVAHNAPFDLAFLRRHQAASGVEWSHPILDTVLLSAVVYGATEQHTLDALCKRLDVTIPAPLRHTALGDAHATAQALVRLLPVLQARGMTRFGDVIEQTRKHGRLLEDMN